MAAIRLEGIEKVFANGQRALDRVDLEVADGERVALVGPSGSGKSTLLRIIAGLERPTRGSVLIGGRDVTGVPPERRDLAMVFQSYALYPHKTVRDNLAFGLRARGIARAEVRSRVEATAASLGLSQLLDRYPAQLSGGQRQRVALGRAIVRAPAAFLFDEPLSNLDPRLRGETRAELIELHGRLGATMVYVTHDQEEAMTLGQRIAVLRDGGLQQVGEPLDVYNRPATTFVAQFIGSPPMNLIDLERSGLRGRLAAPAQAVTVGVRPHDVRPDGRCTLVRAAVQLVEPIGAAQILHLRAGDLRLVAVAPARPAVRPGEPIDVGAEPERLHFFDPAGRRL